LGLLPASVPGACAQLTQPYLDLGSVLVRRRQDAGTPALHWQTARMAFVRQANSPQPAQFRDLATVPFFVSTFAQGVQAVHNGSVDGLIGGPFVAQVAVHSADYPELTIAAVPSDALTSLRFAVATAQSTLRQSMDARLAMTTSEEHAQIRGRWLPDNDGAFYSTPRTRDETALTQRVSLLRVGYITGLPSISDTDDLGHLIGMGPGYVADVGSALGMRLQFVYAGSSAELTQRLDSGDIDVAIDGVSSTQVKATPTLPYLRTPLALVTRRSSDDQAHGELNGHRFYLGEDVVLRRADLQAMVPRSELTVGHVASSIGHVARGDTAGFIGSAATIDAYLQQHPGLPVHRVLLGARDLDVSFWVSERHAALLPVINRALANLTSVEQLRVRQGYGKYAYSAGPPWQVLALRYGGIGLGVLAALAVFVIANMRLRTEVRRRQHAEAELLDRANLKRTILETLPYPLVAVDTEGRVQSSNSAYAAMSDRRETLQEADTPFAHLHDPYWQTLPIGQQVAYRDSQNRQRYGIYYQRSRITPTG
jgi:PAS domain-containing protein/ABC-type amino acid transport substrate-binding protein